MLRNDSLSPGVVTGLALCEPSDHSRIKSNTTMSITDRLPPGQHRTDKWPILDLGIRPILDQQNWYLTVDGLVSAPITLDYEAFCRQQQSEYISDIHCVTAWSRFDNHWSGVAARHLLNLVQPLPTARHILFTSYDGYTVNLSRTCFDQPDVLLATMWEGQPIPLEHGGPVRVIVPQLYFWKSAKWIQRITFIAEDKPGYWEQRGYHNEGNPWSEERYG